MEISPWIQTLVSVVIAVIASSGFWTFVIKRSEKKDLRTQILIGLGHDRIMALGELYIERGYITADEYENMYEYLYKPYTALGGNGTAKRMMDEVNRLPFCNNKDGSCAQYDKHADRERPHP